MCMQCVTKSINFEKNLVPGWFLCRATVDAYGRSLDEEDHVKAGDWGIGRCNDPVAWFVGEPKPDVYFGLKGEAWDKAVNEATPEQKIADDEFMKFLDGVDEVLEMSPQNGHSLVKGCIEVGWDPEEGGFGSFVAHKIWEASQSKQVTHEEQGMSPEEFKKWQEGDHQEEVAVIAGSAILLTEKPQEEVAPVAEVPIVVVPKPIGMGDKVVVNFDIYPLYKSASEEATIKRLGEEVRGLVGTVIECYGAITCYRIDFGNGIFRNLNPLEILRAPEEVKQ